MPDIVKGLVTRTGFIIRVADGRFLGRHGAGWGPEYCKGSIDLAEMFASEEAARKKAKEWASEGAEVVRVRETIERVAYRLSESSAALLKAVHEINAAYGQASASLPKPKPAEKSARAQRNDDPTDRRTDNEKYYNCKRALGQSGCECWLCKAADRRYNDERDARRKAWEDSQGPAYWRQQIKEAEDREHRNYIERLNNGDHDYDRWP